MKRKLAILMTVILAVSALSACAVPQAAAPAAEPAVEKPAETPAAEVKEEAAEPVEEVTEPAVVAKVDEIIKVKSKRDTDIPTGVMLPEHLEGEKCPVVLFAHGFLDDMDEVGYFREGAYNEGKFTGVADQLLDLGIGSVRIDFPGCGSSTESLENYTNENMVSDLTSAYKYALENYPIDPERIAVFGWSYGGRIAPLFVKENPEVKTVLLSSPVAANGGEMWPQIINACGFDYDSLIKEAKETGKATLDFGDGLEHCLSMDFFTQNDEAKPCDVLANYDGTALLVYGKEDAVVPAWAYEEVVKNTNIEYVAVPGADHDFGFTSEGEAAARLTAINNDIVTSFLCKQLLPSNKKSAVDEIIQVKSERGTDIPTGVLLPEHADDEKCPIVIFAHGLLDDMDEVGYFREGAYNEGKFEPVADQLVKLGIGSVRIDFPGCGSSTESLENYTNSNMVADLSSAYDYVLKNYPVDPDRVAIFGWSNGGRIAPLFIEKHPEIKTVLLSSAVAANGGKMWEQVINACGLDYKSIIKEAQETGKANLDFGDGLEHNLSIDFFKQNDEAKTCDILANYDGTALLIYGEDDAVVPAWAYEEVVKNTNIEYAAVPGADHDFGFTSEGEAAARLTAINHELVTSYLYKHLVVK